MWGAHILRRFFVNFSVKLLCTPCNVCGEGVVFSLWWINDVCARYYSSLLKVKVSHYMPRRRVCGRRGVAPTHSRPRHWMVVSVTSRLRFSSGERTPGTHRTGGWVGSRDGLDTEATGKLLLPLPGIEPRSPGRSAHSQTLYWLSYPVHTLCCSVLSTRQIWAGQFVCLPYPSPNIPDLLRSGVK
jgi:hypothetical protein